MSLGLLLLLGTGICWAGLAAVMAAGTERQAPASKIQPYAAMLILLVAGWTAFIGDEPVSLAKVWPQFLCLAASGASNFFMLNLVQRAMRSGKNGIVWAFTQSSMVLPFLLGILFFGEPMTVFRLAGFILVFSGLFGFALGKKEGEGTGKWLAPALAAFFLSGIAQCFASLPSYLRVEGVNVARRMLLVQGGLIMAYTIDALVRRKPVIPQFKSQKTVWILSGIFGGFNLASLFLLYNALNYLAEAKCASAGYPIAQGLGISLFFLSSCRKNRPSTTDFFAFFLILLGIAAMAV